MLSAMSYKHWLCCLFLDVLWKLSQNLRVKLEMTSAVWGGEREAWRAAESWRVKSYGQASHSHLSKPVQQAEMGISEASYANFKYWILIILWLHQKIPPAIYILPSLRKTMHLNSHQPTTRDSKVWRKKNHFDTSPLLETEKIMAIIIMNHDSWSRISKVASMIIYLPPLFSNLR